MTRFMHTPSAGGLIVHEGKVLVITSELRGSVDLPKGTVEPGESLEETALREVQEETGYRTLIKKDLGSITYDFDDKHGKSWRKTVSYFLMDLADSEEQIKNLQPSEDFENEWLTPAEALNRLTYLDARTLVQRSLEQV